MLTTSNWLKKLSYQVTKEDLENFRITQDIKEHDIENFINLWLTEGIPFAFKDIPFLYQIIRYKLSKDLGIHSKNISLIGSARLGFSSTHFKNFNIENSDLDFFMVSQDYFDKIVEEIKNWLLEEQNDRKKTIKNQKERGFLNTWYIPNCHQYTKKVNTSVTNINTWLHNQDCLPKINKNPKWAGIRIYRDWDAVVKQNILSLKKC